MPIYTAPGSPAQARIDAIKSFLSLFSKKTQVEFSFSRSPQTDGRVVWLGDLDADNPDFEVYAAGHGIHEMMHVYATDWSALGAKRLSSFEQALVNVLEDVRIDALGMQMYPGYAAYRYELAGKLQQQGRLHVCSHPAALGACELFCVWIHAALMRSLQAPWALERYEAFASEIGTKMDADKLSRALEMASTAYQAADTGEIISIARKISRLVTAQAPQQSADKEADNGKPESFEKALKSTDRAELSRCLGLLDQAPPKQSRQATGPQPGSPATGSGYAPAAASPGRVTLWRADPNVPETSWESESYVAAFSGKRGELARLTQAFESLLEAKRESKDEESGDDGAALSSDFLSRIAARDSRIFTTPAENRAPDGAVEILLDRSGSMGLEMLTSAKLAVAALMTALCGRRGISVEAAVFPGPSKAPVSIVLQRGDSLSLGLERMRSVNSYGGTPLWNALEWGLKQLRRERSQVRLLILITDGIFPAQLLRDAEKTINASGVEFAVISIEATNSGLARNQCNVREPGEIAPALLRLIEKTNARQRMTRFA
ncbi:MAG TPA: hypothetical protein DEO49_01960 [Sutterella sp.]|nr:hypothetical protein [Sutterella sp.]